VNCPNEAVCGIGTIAGPPNKISQIGGDSGRSNAYTYQPARFNSTDPSRIPFLVNRSIVFRVENKNNEFTGTLRGVTFTSSSLWAICDNPFGLYQIDTPSDSNSRLVPKRVEITGGRVMGEDPIISMNDNLYILLEGKAVWKSGVERKEVEGNFVSQCIHPRGWILIEEVSGENGKYARIHCCTPQGDQKLDPIDFPKRSKYLAYTYPVADENGFYLTDDNGQVWMFKWDLSRSEGLPNDPVGMASPMLYDSKLYALPLGADKKYGCQIDLASPQYHSTRTAAMDRKNYASAIGNLGDTTILRKKC
jgi:hypothetical protein